VEACAANGDFKAWASTVLTLTDTFVKDEGEMSSV